MEFTPVASTVKETVEDDEIGKDFSQALSHHRRGNYKAAMAAAADAMNALALRESIHGGGWY